MVSSLPLLSKANPSFQEDTWTDTCLWGEKEEEWAVDHICLTLEKKQERENKHHFFIASHNNQILGTWLKRVGGVTRTWGIGGNLSSPDFSPLRGTSMNLTNGTHILESVFGASEEVIFLSKVESFPVQPSWWKSEWMVYTSHASRGFMDFCKLRPSLIHEWHWRNGTRFTIIKQKISASSHRIVKFRKLNCFAEPPDGFQRKGSWRLWVPYRLQSSKYYICIYF